MPEVSISVGGREFSVVCQDGEQDFLIQAAELLNAEAAMLGEQLGRMPETRMLLMAGLMLADKAVGLEDQMRSLEEKILSQEAMIEELNARPSAGGAAPATEEATAQLAEIVAEAENIANAMDTSAG